jgi:hypothetical protein
MDAREYVNKRFQFRVVGTSIRCPVRPDFHTAAMDAVAADFADWGEGGRLVVRNGGQVDEVAD